jgi:hypothetical protein
MHKQPNSSIETRDQNEVDKSSTTLLTERKQNMTTSWYKKSDNIHG